jgi:beta-mannosidase
MKTYPLDGTWQVAGVAFGIGRQKRWERLSELDVSPILHSYLDESIPAVVPGDVHLDLCKAGLLKEPLVHRNADDCGWVAECEWWYRKEFELTELEGTHYEIVFDGLDTTAEIWINGVYLGSHNNMFVPIAFDVTNALRIGKNVVVVKLDAGLKSCEGKPLEPYKRITKVDDTRRVWVRKAQFSFGWDWAPSLLTCGIWRGVRLCMWDEAAIRSVYLHSDIGVGGSEAILLADVALECFSLATVEAILSLRCKREKQEYIIRIPVILEPGHNEQRLSVNIDKPALWWPISHGQAHLYDITVGLEKEGRVISKYSCRHGFRKIEVVEENRQDGLGKSFYLRVNDVPVFCKGANWVPADSIPARVSDNRLESLLTDAVSANFNMLRVWGGGYYESSRFYELCDELGIMVWQDFMFACGYYPDDDPSFCAEVKREAEIIVRRLCNHPSLVLWCGDNENDWIYQRELAVDPNLVYRGERLNKEIIPEVVARLDPKRGYVPSTPFGHGPDVNASDSGDQHNWEVTLMGPSLEAKADFTQYAKDKGSFVSEFGLLCPPNRETLRTMLAPGQRFVGSADWHFHNNTLEKGVQLAVVKTFWACERTSLPNYVRMLQAYHAEGLKFAFEHYRHRMYDCGGALFWQYNDSWGTIGWSIIDYYLRKKPSYYAVRRALASPLLVIKAEPRQVHVWLVRDEATSMEGEIIVRWISFSGRDEILARKAFRIRGSGSNNLLSVNLESDKHQAHAGLVVAELWNGNDLVTWNRQFLQSPGQLPLGEAPILLKGQKRSDGWDLQLKCQRYAWLVWIDAGDDAWLSDNGFDIRPSHIKQVNYRGKARTLDAFHITCLNDLCLAGSGRG